MINDVGPIFQKGKTSVFKTPSGCDNFINSVFPPVVARVEYLYSNTSSYQARYLAHKKVNDALARAKSQVGNIENPLLGNRTSFISKYRAPESKDHKTPVTNEYAYCASFVSWCYDNDNSAIGYEKYTPKIKEKAEKAGFYTEKEKLGNGDNNTYMPKSGDLIMWLNPEKYNPKTHKMEKRGGHVGIIESCIYDYTTNQIVIATIEGNTIPKGEAETAAASAKGEGPEGVLRKVYTLDELKQNSKMNGVVRMEDWLTLSELKQIK